MSTPQVQHRHENTGAKLERPSYQLSLFSAAALVEYPGFTMSPQAARSFQARLDPYLNYCHHRNLETLSALSAASHLEHIARTKSYESIRRMVDDVRLYFRMQDRPDPFTLPTRQLLIPFEHKCVPARRYDAPEPVGAHAFRKLIEAIPYDDSSLRDVRDRALLLVIYGGFFKGVEIEALERAEVDFSPGFEGVELHPTSRRDSVPIPAYSEVEFCVAHSLEAWVKRAGIREGPLFRPIHTNRALTRPLRASNLQLPIQIRFREAGLPTLNMGVSPIKWGALITAIQRGVDPHVIHRMSGMSYETIRIWTNRAESSATSAELRRMIKKRR